MVRTPAFYKTRITPESLLQYYTAVADASPAPVILYNITGFTGVNLLPETAAELSHHPNVIGIKDSGGDITVISDLVAQCRQGFPVLACDDDALCVAVRGWPGRNVRPGAVARDLAGIAGGLQSRQSRRAPTTAGVARPHLEVDQHEIERRGLKVAVDAYGLTGGPPRVRPMPFPTEGVRVIHRAGRGILKTVIKTRFKKQVTEVTAS